MNRPIGLPMFQALLLLAFTARRLSPGGKNVNRCLVLFDPRLGVATDLRQRRLAVR